MTLRIVISLFCLLLAACVSPDQAKTSKSALCEASLTETSPVFQIGSTSDIGIEDLITSTDDYIQGREYNLLRQPYRIVPRGVETIRVLIADAGYSSFDLALVEISKRRLCEDTYEHRMRILTEGEPHFPRRGVTEDVVITRDAEITYDEYAQLRSNYQQLIAEPAVEEGGICSHCIGLRIDSAGIEGGAPRNLNQTDQDFLRDAAFAEAMLGLAVKEFPKLAGLAQRISDSVENVRRDNRLD